MNDLEWAKLRETVERHADDTTREFTVSGFRTGVGTSYKVELFCEGRKKAFDLTDYSCW